MLTSPLDILAIPAVTPSTLLLPPATLRRFRCFPTDEVNPPSVAVVMQQRKKTEIAYRTSDRQSTSSFNNSAYLRPLPSAARTPFYSLFCAVRVQFHSNRTNVSIHEGLIVGASTSMKIYNIPKLGGCGKRKTKFCHSTPRARHHAGELDKMGSFHFTLTLAGWPRRE